MCCEKSVGEPLKGESNPTSEIKTISDEELQIMCDVMCEDLGEEEEMEYIENGK